MLSFKTRSFNFFRSFIINTFIERLLANSIRNQIYFSSTLRKFIPNNYQYLKPTTRKFTHNELALSVDISDFIGHSVYFGLNQDLIKLFQLCKANDIVFDIGVNIGWTALNLSRFCRNGRVYGFEPDTKNFEACSDNFKLNPHLSNIILNKLALGDQEAMVNMVISEPTNLGGNRISDSNINTIDADVRMTTLDSFFSMHSLSKLDLVKIDTEGYELKVLQGGRSTLLKLNPTLFIEVIDSNLRRNGDSAKSLIEFLYEIGYKNIINSETGEIVNLNDDFSQIQMDIIVTA